MSGLFMVMARLTAGPLGLAMLVAVPAASHAAPATRAGKPSPAPLLAGPLRVLAPFGIATSVLRSVEHNKRIGGVPNSYHLVGQAIDVRRHPGVTHRMVDAALRRAGFLLVESLDEIDHSHFAFLPGGAAPRLPLPSTTPPVTLAKQAPAQPRVAADLHGILVIDGQRSDIGNSSREQMPSPSVLAAK